MGRGFLGAAPRSARGGLAPGLREFRVESGARVPPAFVESSIRSYACFVIGNKGCKETSSMVLAFRPLDLWFRVCFCCAFPC